LAKPVVNVFLSGPVLIHQYHIQQIGSTVTIHISERQAQSGHSNTQTLLGYIQHTLSRIRKGYDKTFQNVTDANLITGNAVSSVKLDNESYKKVAIKKYLDGELDNNALHAILKTLDADKHVEKKLDLAYQ
jgi:hypothetical protein